MVLILASPFVFGLLIMWTAVVPLVIVVSAARFWLFTRGLELADEVPKLNRADAIDRAVGAMGARTIAAICIAAALLVMICGTLLARGVRSVALWMLMAYFAVVAVLYAVRWRQVRN